MPTRHLLLRIAVIASILAQLVLFPFAAVPAAAATPPIVDDFETGLPAGLDGAVAIGFNTFQDPNSTRLHRHDCRATRTRARRCHAPTTCCR